MKSPEAANPLPREPAEPTFGSGALPMWLVAVLGLLCYWGCIYTDDHSGRFQALVYEPYRSTNELAEFLPKSDVELAITAGKRVFEQNCAPCHQTTGLGEAAKAPPLAGSDWVLASGPNRIVRVVLNGLKDPIVVKGQEWNLVMLPWRDIMTDAQIAHALTYVRNSWGNKATEVKPEQVKKIRDATQDRGDNWTAPELLKIPESDSAP